MRCSILFLFLAVSGSAPALAQQADAVPQDLSLYTKASLRMHQQRHDEALKLLDELLRGHPKSPVVAGARFFKAQCLEELGRREEARAAYQELIALHAASGWARDAKRRVTYLTRAAAVAPTTAPKLPAGKPAQLLLTNGDKLSGTIVERAGKVYQLQLAGVGEVLHVPKDRVLSVTSGRPARLAAPAPGALPALPQSRREVIVSLLSGDVDVDIDVDDGDGVKTTTRRNEDGSKTVIKVYPDGTRVETTVSKKGKDRRVTVVRERKGAEAKRKVELRFDDDFDFELPLEGLKDLPKKLREQLKGLEDLDFDLELDELKDLEEGLDKLPEQIRKRIKKSLRTPRRKLRKVFRWKNQRGEQEEDFLFVPDGEHGKRGRAFAFGDRIRKRVIVRGGPGGGGVWFGHHDGHDFTAFDSGTKDRVYLRNGDKISGKLLSVDGSRVRMKTSYGEVTIKRDQVGRITFGRAPTPYLGVVMAAAKKGVKLSQVFKGSPAAKAGLKSGDVVTAVDGAAIDDGGDLGKAIQGKKVGQTLKLAIQRGDQTLTIEVKLGAKPSGGWGFDGSRGYRFMPRTPRPPRPPMAPRPPSLREHEHKLRKHEREQERKLREYQRGLRDKHRHKALEQARKAREQARKAREKARGRARAPRGGRPFLGVGLEAVDGGVKITNVRDGSTAQAIGLRRGDVITHWNGERVRTTEDLIKALRASKVGDEATLRAKRGEGGVLELKFRLRGKARSGEGGSSYAPRAPVPPAADQAPAPPKARDF